MNQDVIIWKKIGKEVVRVPAGKFLFGVVVRGGSFINDRLYVRCTFRDWALPDSGLRLVGFRLAVSLPE